ncbi:sodium:calcium antiporter [bacterium]|nr:sodium:calcium antiporter [bacterium]
MVLTLYIIQILVSIILLWKGSDILVESSVNIARYFGVPQLIIGLTIVALGTSAPELTVTIGAALTGQSNISVSNVIGSNIFNLGFILGSIAIVKSVKTSPRLIARDGSVLIGATIAVLFMVWDTHLSRFEGLILLTGLVIYNIFLIRNGKKNKEESKEEKLAVKDIVNLVSGIAVVVLGGYFLRNGSVGIARMAGLSEWVIGATVVAAGTSAPEFVTSLMATLKGHYGISAGNLVGSCIYNFMGVLGIAVVIRPMNVAASARQTMIMTFLIIVTALVLLATRKKMSRLEGVFLFLLSAVVWIVEFM